MILMDKGQPGQHPLNSIGSGGAQLDEWQLWDINQPLLRLLCQTSLAKVCNHNMWWRQVLHSSSGLLHLGAVPVNQFDGVLWCCDASFVGWKLSAISTSLNFEGRNTNQISHQAQSCHNQISYQFLSSRWPKPRWIDRWIYQIYYYLSRSICLFRKTSLFSRHFSFHRLLITRLEATNEVKDHRAPSVNWWWNYHVIPIFLWCFD